jgi:hypothetical protein
LDFCEKFQTFSVTKVYARTQWGASDPKDASKIVKFNIPTNKVFLGRIYPGSEELLCSTLVSFAT